MAILFTPAVDHQKTQHVIGDLQVLVGTLTFSGSYAVGGEVPSVASPPGGTGLKQLFRQFGVGEVIQIVASVRGNDAEYDNANDKVKIYTAANTEHTAVAYNAALTGSPVPCTVYGR